MFDYCLKYITKNGRRINFDSTIAFNKVPSECKEILANELEAGNKNGVFTIDNNIIGKWKVVR